MSIDPVTFMDTWNPAHFNRYAYGNNDPVNMIDPDGRESIFVSGGEYGSHNTGRHFPQNAYSRAFSHAMSQDRNTTLLMYRGGTKSAQKWQKYYSRAANRVGLNVVNVSSASDVSNYINTKSVDGSAGGRAADPVTSLSYVGHGKPGVLSLDYPTSANEISPSSDISSSAFGNGENVTINMLGTCNAAAGKNSVTDQFSSMLGSTSSVSGYSGTIFFGGGYRTDDQLGSQSRPPAIREDQQGQN